MKRLVTLLTAAAVLTLGACNKKSENPPAGSASGSSPPATAGEPVGSAAAGMAAGSAGAGGSGSAAGSASAGSGSAAEAAGSGSAAASVDVPTEVDFEDQATAKITDKNVEAQVKALEKDLETR